MFFFSVGGGGGGGVNIRKRKRFTEDSKTHLMALTAVDG